MRVRERERQGQEHFWGSIWKCRTCFPVDSLGATSLVSTHSHPLPPAPRTPRARLSSNLPPSLWLCTAQLTKHICVYCVISAEHTEQGNDMQQRPRNDALALRIAGYLRRRRHASPSEAQLRLVPKAEPQAPGKAPSGTQPEEHFRGRPGNWQHQ